MKKIIALTMLLTSINGHAFERKDYSVRAMGMGGAFIAQADDSSALFYNPAGMGVLGDAASSTFDFSLYNSTVEHVYSEDMAENQDNYAGIMAMWQKGRGAIGIGAADSYTIDIVRPLTQYVSEPVRVSSTEWIAGGAWGNDYAKLGLAFSLIEATASSDEKNPESDTCLGTTISGKLTPLDGFADLSNHSFGYTLNLGAVYKTQCNAEPDKKNINSSLSNREMTIRPEYFGGGLNLGLFWLNSYVSSQLNLNADIDRSHYYGFTDLLPIDESIRQGINEVEVSRIAFGAELLLAMVDSHAAVILRAGQSTQTDNLADYVSDNTKTLGLGVAYRAVTFDFSVSTITPNKTNPLTQARKLYAGSVAFNW